MDDYRHPCEERSDMTPDAMIEHNRTVGFRLRHAGARYFDGVRRGVEQWQNVFGEAVDGPGDQTVEGYLARRDADRARISAYVETPRPAVSAEYARLFGRTAR